MNRYQEYLEIKICCEICGELYKKDLKCTVPQGVKLPNDFCGCIPAVNVAWQYAANLNTSAKH